MKASVIISYYKNLGFLKLILKSLMLQTEQDFEVIIAEDDNTQETVSFLKEQQKECFFALEHCRQENLGFRKNKILNQAVLKAKADYLILIDGDCVLHKEFVAAHLKYSKPNTVLIGRRLMLSKSLTEIALEKEDISYFKCLNFIKHGCQKLDCALYLPFINSTRKHGIWGCNWSLYKQMIFDVNGFDEDYVKAAVGEDVDIEWRLRANDASFESVKFKAIQYHLYHKPNYNNDDVNHNFKILETKQNQNLYYCKNGIVKQA